MNAWKLCPDFKLYPCKCIYVAFSFRITRMHKIKRQICWLFQMYPYPIPDLFCGNPLVVSGKFQGKFPDSITVVGLMPDQSTWQLEVPSRKTSKVPLSKVKLHRIPSPSSYDSNCTVLCGILNVN